MQTVTITRIFREKKTSKAGKPFTSLRIQTREQGDRWISGFGNQSNDAWQEGQTVEIEIEQNGQYLNFKMPEGQKLSKTWNKIAELEERIKALEKQFTPRNEQAAAVELTPDEMILPF